MVEFDLKGILVVLVPVLVAIAGGFFTFLAGRGKGLAEAEKASAEAESNVRHSVNNGFQMLIGELRKERQELIQVVDAQSEEIVQLRTEVRGLTRVVAKMEQLLIRHGIALPDESNAPQA